MFCQCTVPARTGCAPPVAVAAPANVFACGRVDTSTCSASQPGADAPFAEVCTARGMAHNCTTEPCLPYCYNRGWALGWGWGWGGTTTSPQICNYACNSPGTQGGWHKLTKQSMVSTGEHAWWPPRLMFGALLRVGPCLRLLVQVHVAQVRSSDSVQYCTVRADIVRCVQDSRLGGAPMVAAVPGC